MIQTETTVLEKWSNMDQRNGPYNMVLPIAFNVTYERNLYLEKWFAPPSINLEKALAPPSIQLEKCLAPPDYAEQLYASSIAWSLNLFDSHHH